MAAGGAAPPGSRAPTAAAPPEPDDAMGCPQTATPPTHACAPRWTDCARSIAKRSC